MATYTAISVCWTHDLSNQATRPVHLDGHRCLPAGVKHSDSERVAVLVLQYITDMFRPIVFGWQKGNTRVALDCHLLRLEEQAVQPQGGRAAITPGHFGEDMHEPYL